MTERAYVLMEEEAKAVIESVRGICLFYFLKKR